MRRLLLILLLAFPAAAQITESIEVHVLEIEVSVLDRAGKPVEGLTAADFEVRVNRKPTEISNLYLVKRGAIVDETRGAAGSQPAEAPPAIVPTRLVLFVDDLHLHQRTKKRAVASLRNFVEKTMDDATTAMLVRWNGSLSVVVPATKDRARLLAAIDGMATEPGLMRNVDSQRRLLGQLAASMDPDIVRQHYLAYCESQARDTRQTIDALREVTRAASGLEGRKILLHVSEGLPMFAGWEMLASIEGGKGQIPLEVMKFNLDGQYRALVKFAQQSSVVFCPFDASGPEGAAYAVDIPEGNPNPDLIRENVRATATLLARETGGQLIADTNELDLALARVTDQVTTYYSLGVSAPSGSRGPFNIAVRLRNRPELRVVTAPRRNVTSEPERIANGVRSRLYFREEANPLEARLRVSAPKREGNRCVVHVSADVKKAISPVTFHFAVIDDRQQESNVRTVQAPLVSLGLSPRKYVFSAAIVENLSGETSYLQQDIDATGCKD
ncbi:MAG TPA: VWA domain-containing protein [Thermoanaerobaculia bacterium]|nr:VWA domain-containing protein [Thermoanaerobaculia bacterium]